MPVIRHLLPAVAFVLCALCQPVHGSAGHYLVFAIDEEGRAEPLFHAHAAFDQRNWPMDHAAMGRPKRSTVGGFSANARAYEDGALVFARTLELQPLARSEGARADGSMAIDMVDAGAAAFVLRLPAGADRLLIDLGHEVQAFELDQLAKSAATLPLAHMAGASRVVGKRMAGPPGNRLDLLIMGDGYVAGQEGLFNALADEVEAEFFGVSPMREYAGLVNLSRLFTPSAQMGADHPPYIAATGNCTHPQCCFDASAQHDFLAPRFVDTAFDATFCAGWQIHRALGINVGKVLAAASAVPDWDVIMVLVNDPVYGGLGYMRSPDGSMPGIAIGSATDGAVQLMMHELGHSLIGLGDEYAINIANPGPPYCSDRGGDRPCMDNHTDVDDPAAVKWRAWFEPGIPVPSPSSARGVGLFEGVIQYPQGLYRPTFTACLMHSTAFRDLCPVCRESFVTSLYSGRFGEPAGGIDLIEPGTESPPPHTPVPHLLGSVQRFEATVIAPQVQGIERQWLLDGEPLPGAAGDALDLELADGITGTRTLELRVIDRGPYLKSQHALDLGVHSRVWTLKVLPQAEEDFVICPALSGAWYNAATAGQGLFLDVSEDPRLLFGGWFTWRDVVGEHDWFTLQGAYALDDHSVVLPIVHSGGGRFDDPAEVDHQAVGEARLTFLGCNAAMLEYRFDAGREGVMLLDRLLPIPGLCTELCRDAAP
ncbi:MAG TPA: M64 family metallopeptidase [Xanthomonadaceae bacterium]|nr:M64 family metallopeptidase [Xanthomonadaceae bacterium]